MILLFVYEAAPSQKILATIHNAGSPFCQVGTAVGFFEFQPENVYRYVRCAFVDTFVTRNTSRNHILMYIDCLDSPSLKVNITFTSWIFYFSSFSRTLVLKNVRKSTLEIKRR